MISSKEDLTMEGDAGASGPSWSVSETNMTSSDVENIVHMPAVTFPAGIEHESDGTMPTLLIGLDKYFFEQGDEARDVVFINGHDNSNQMKFSTIENKNFLTAGNYVISFVESSKETSWETALLRNIRKFKQDGPEVPDFSEPGGSGHLVEEKDATELIFNVSDCFVDEKNLLQLNTTLGSSTLESSAADPVPEEKLPLKKKAKMKGPDVKESSAVIEPLPEPSILASKTCSSTSVKYRTRRPGKRRCCYSDSEPDDDEVTVKTETVEGFTSMAELVQRMQENNIFDAEFTDLIMAGLSDMSVNIFDELKKNPTEGNSSPSNQLLAFAFLLHFKCRPAYRFLHVLFGDNWPTRIQLKEWQTLINSRPKNKLKKTSV